MSFMQFTFVLLYFRCSYLYKLALIGKNFEMKPEEDTNYSVSRNVAKS